MEIRSATPDDADVLARVLIDAWRSAYRGLVPDSHLNTLDYAKRGRRFREALTDHSEETYLAEEEGEVLGFLTLGRCRDTDLDEPCFGEIWGINVAPEHWRKGTGRALCRYAERILQSRGYTMASLWVFSGNARARRYWETMGFQADGTSKTLNVGTPLEAVRYRKQLGNAGDSDPAERLRAAAPPRLPTGDRPHGSTGKAGIGVSPRILQCEWGRLEVERLGTGKDMKLWPGGGRSWDWSETGTRHVPGIQVADVEELLDHGSEVVVLSRGMELRLKTQPETLDYLSSRGVAHHVAGTREAVQLYNELSSRGERAGGLFHSTC